MPHTRSARQYELLLVFVTIIAAAGWVFTKSALAEFSPYIFLALRFLLAGIVLSCLCWKQLICLKKEQWVKGISTGCLLGSALLIWILGVAQTQNIGEGAFIVSLGVVVVPLLARFLFDIPFTRNVLIALIPAVTGLACLSFSGSGHLGFEFNITHLLFLLSTVGFALHVILTGRYAQGIPYMPLTAMQVTAIGLMATVAALIFESWPETLSLISWWWLLCSALIATSLRFALQTKALARLDPNNAAMIFILEPVWTALLAMIFLSEHMTAFQLTGCFLIFLSLVVYRLPTIIKSRHFV